MSKPQRVRFTPDGKPIDKWIDKDDINTLQKVPDGEVRFFGPDAGLTTQDSNKALEEKARKLHQRLDDDDCGGIASKCPRCGAILAVLREVAEAAFDAGRREEAADVEGLLTDFMDETVEWLLRMNRTADPGTDEPKNFEPDLRTRTAIAAWLMDSRKPLLLEILRRRGKGSS